MANLWRVFPPSFQKYAVLTMCAVPRWHQLTIGHSRTIFNSSAIKRVFPSYLDTGMILVHV